MTITDVLNMLESKQLAARAMAKHASKVGNKAALKQYQNEFKIYSDLIKEVKFRNE